MTAPIRVKPATTIVHLEFNGGEGVDVLLDVSDDDDELVPLTSAVATIKEPGGGVFHTWSVAAGNLTVGPGPGQVVLHCPAAATLAWQVWGDAEWQLDVVDVTGVAQRPCEGDVRINPSRRSP